MTDDEPMHQLYILQGQLPEQPCWTTEINRLRCLYSIADDATIQQMSREVYKQYIKKKIRTFTFASLIQRLQTNKKVNNLVYTQFKQQSYLTMVTPRVLKIIARIRSQTLNIPPHRPYLFGGRKDAPCRHCKLDVETVHHILNCYVVSSNREKLNTNVYREDMDVVECSRVAEMIHTFLS